MHREVLLRSYSGVRFLSRHADPQLISRYALALGEYIGPGSRLVLIGRDTRPISRKVLRCFCASLTALGFDIVYAGVCPTPTVQLLVRQTGAGAGIVLTASHNPQQWGGFKFIGPDGVLFSRDQVSEIYGICDAILPARVPSRSRLQPPVPFDDFWTRSSGFDHVGAYFRSGVPPEFQRKAMNLHIEKVLCSVSVDAVRSRRFDVVIDSANGAGSLISPAFLAALGCKVSELYANPARFSSARHPEPVPQNLSRLYRRVRSGSFVAGFAQDSDADRLAFCTERGEPVNEEFTLTLSILSTLLKLRREGSGSRGVVVTNITSTRSNDAIVKRFGARLIKTRVGEVNIAEKMKKAGAHIGGEGNGGVINPRVHYGRDSLVAMGIILQLMADEGAALSEIVKQIPQYHPVKLKFGRIPEQKKAELVEQFPGARKDRTDGLRLDLKDMWISVRDSNTEPVSRVIGEADTEELARQMEETAIRIFGQPRR